LLQKFDISNSDLEKLSEVKFNALLEKHFKEYIENVRKSDITNQGFIDLNIANRILIEIKLSRELKKNFTM